MQPVIAFVTRENWNAKKSRYYYSTSHNVRFEGILAVLLRIKSCGNWRGAFGRRVLDVSKDTVLTASHREEVNSRTVLTYLLTPWCRVLLEKLTSLQLVEKFPAFHGTRRFITALTSIRHLSLSWARPIQSIYPHPTSWWSILILSTHLRLGLPSGLLPSGFPTQKLHTPLSSPIRATCPAHHIIHCML